MQNRILTSEVFTIKGMSALHPNQLEAVRIGSWLCLQGIHVLHVLCLRISVALIDLFT